ncbi:hypothetical protein HAX54_016355 [Datura stramonium]|uniref:Uncharacterized protein n=1 Tax=Datura stramonium TaxID=4076 RepID=A0ABS8UKN3_DATST|nr:hypothetical protein [Datura stramonium]
MSDPKIKPKCAIYTSEKFPEINWQRGTEGFVEHHLRATALSRSLTGTWMHRFLDSVARRLSRSLNSVPQTCHAPSLESGCAAKSSQRVTEVNAKHRLRDTVPSHTFTGILPKILL